MTELRADVQLNSTGILRLIAAFGVSVPGLILLVNWPLRQWLDSGAGLGSVNQLSQTPGLAWMEGNNAVLVFVLFCICALASYLLIGIPARTFDRKKYDATLLRLATAAALFVPILVFFAPGSVMPAQAVTASKQPAASDVVIPCMLIALALVLIGDRLIVLFRNALRAPARSRWGRPISILLRLTALCALAVPFIIGSTVYLLSYTDLVEVAAGCDVTATLGGNAWLSAGLALSFALASLIVAFKWRHSVPPAQEPASVF